MGVIALAIYQLEIENEKTIFVFWRNTGGKSIILSLESVRA